MSRHIPKNPHAKFLHEAAEYWRDNCLLGEGSVFSDEKLWNREYFEHDLQEHYIKRLNDGGDALDFFKRLEIQMEGAKPEVKKLMAEVWWLVNFSLVIGKPATKRNRCKEIWSWSGSELPAGKLLEDQYFKGIVKVGPASSTYMWAELLTLILVIAEWKKLDSNEQHQLAKNSTNFSGQLDKWLSEFDEIEWMIPFRTAEKHGRIVQCKNRIIRHILNYLLFPDEFERVFSGGIKREIVEYYTDMTSKQLKDKTWPEIDELLREVRSEQEKKHDRDDLDFFAPPLRGQWKKEPKPDESKVDNEEETNGTNDIYATSSPLNRIFYGPPGTGKTYRTIDETLLILDPKFYERKKTNRKQLRGRFEALRQEKRIEFVTFHQSFGYEEFVEGIRPLLGEEGQAQELLYEIKDGVFKYICSNAKKKKEPYVLIIDEINRGNISKIFGELITLVEESRRAGNAEATTATLPYSGESFSVPANLYLIGTMNTADRSIALLDTALRRRFEFVEMMPDSTKLKGIVFEDLDIPALLTAINRRIEALYDRDHQIGHTYFLPLEKSPTVEKLASIFRNAVLPLLQEYFYDDWEKIDVVLNGNGFVTSDDMPEMRKTVFVDREKKIWRIGDQSVFENIRKYKGIYKDNTDNGNTDNEAPTDDNIE